MKLIDFIKEAAKENVEFTDSVLQCLYLIKQNDWDSAHNIAQDDPSKFGSLLHAFLHRIEGDDWNASYWYRRAGEKDFTGSFEEEWHHIAGLYLKE